MIAPAQFISMPSGAELIVILVIALLIFGKRLPDVARSMGKAVVEFKKGIREVSSDIDEQSRMDSGVKKIDRQGNSAALPASRTDSHPLDSVPAPPSSTPSNATTEIRQ